MIKSQASTLIAQPVDAVFDYVATDFFSNYRHWSPEVASLQQLTNGPVCLGTEGRQVRIDMGLRTECRFRVNVYEPGSRIDFLCTSPQILSSYRFEEVGQRSRLTFIFEYSGSTLLLRPFSRQIHKTVQRGAQQVVANIRRLLETSA